MDNKGQGALEYLILIAGAIIVAAIVITILAQTSDPTAHQINQTTNNIFHILNIEEEGAEGAGGP